MRYSTLIAEDYGGGEGDGGDVEMAIAETAGKTPRFTSAGFS